MRQILLTIALALLVGGCDNKNSNNTQNSQIQNEVAQAQNKEIPLEFPYYAVITCGRGFAPYQCFFGQRNVNTVLEIRNGSDYKMYTPIEMMVLPLDNGKLVIDLRQNFELEMQNANDYLILNLKIYNTTNDQIIFEKSASKFGMIRISN